MPTREPQLIRTSGDFPFEVFLLPIVFVVVIGLTIWLTLALLRRRGKSKGNVDTGYPASASSTKPALISLWHPSGGAWEITIQGKRYVALENVPDEAVRQEVVAGLRQLAGFARTYLQKQKRQPQTEPKTPTAPKASAGSGTVLPNVPPTPTTAQSLDSGVAPQALLERTAPKQPPRSPIAPSELRTPARPSTLMPNINLAKEIGEIVQEIQAQTPSLANRSIKLQNAPTGGINFAIDGQVYADVTEIPDPEVQALIRAATKEWERR